MIYQCNIPGHHDADEWRPVAANSPAEAAERIAELWDADGYRLVSGNTTLSVYVRTPQSVQIFRVRGETLHVYTATKEGT